MAHTESGRAYYAGLLEVLTVVMGSAKGYLRDHGPRVATLANQLGMRVGMTSEECSELVFAAVLSDMGMVGLAEDAWENPSPELDPAVRDRVRQHPQRSQQRVREIPHMDNLGVLVRHHHEWWDGSGYPDGLSGEAIPLGARVLRLADTVTALSAVRPHRPAYDEVSIERLVREMCGVEFCPEVGAAWLDSREDFAAPFSDETYRDLVLSAAERLLPLEVENPSTNQLLTIVANLIDAKDPYTGGHSRRVALLAVSVADQLRLVGELKSALWAAGYLHDLGKLAVPLRVLVKNGKLTPTEFDYIRAHPTDGATMLGRIPTLEHLHGAVRHHHEWWDGSGYPDGLAGDDIPQVAQILSVCDAYDAMTSRRAYRDSLGSEYALKEIRGAKGVQFGPDITDAFLDIPSDILEGVHRAQAEAFREIPDRVGTLRHIDPRWFTGEAS